MLSRLRSSVVRNLSVAAQPSDVVRAVSARHQVNDWDQAWPDLETKSNVILDCMQELKVPVPSNVLSFISSPAKLTEYLSEQIKAIEQAAKPVKLPPNLKIE